MLPVRLAFTGEMGSGKDFWADDVARALDLQRRAIAETFKAMWRGIRELAGLPEEKSYARPFLQLMGNVGRAHHPDIWVNVLVLNLKPGEGCVLSDLRFPNEARVLREHGFKIIRVETSDEERRARLAARDGGHNAAFELDDTERFIRDIDVDLIVRGEAEQTDQTREILRRFLYERTVTATATDRQAMDALWDYHYSQSVRDSIGRSKVW